MSKVYLLLVPKYAENINPNQPDPWGNYDGWQVATSDGKVITTTETNHFGGMMPIVEAGEIFLSMIPNEDLMAGMPAKFTDN